MISTKELRGKALRTLRGQVQALQSGETVGEADDQARYSREYQTAADAVVRMLENQIKQTLEHPEEPEPTKPDAATEVRRLRGVLRLIAELPPARLPEVAALASKALVEQARPMPPRPGGGGGGGDRKFTPRRPENRGRSNSGR